MPALLSKIKPTNYYTLIYVAFNSMVFNKLNYFIICRSGVAAFVVL